jgi:hypothetical protein
MLYFTSAMWRQTVLWYVTLPLLAVGVSGLIVFSPRNLTVILSEETAVQPSFPGDGTNTLLDKMIPIFGIAGYLAGYYWWVRWADAQEITMLHGIPFYFELLFAALVVALVHELGHAIVGKALGMRLRVFAVGPFRWYVREGKWEFQFVPSNIFAVGGATYVVPTTLEHFRPNQICMIAAGPLASLIGGAFAFCAAITAPKNPWEQAWHLLALIATLSLLASILNIIPFKAGTAYSDGAQIYQLLSKGPWSDYHRTVTIVHSTLVTPLRPRDFDIEAIQRASSCIARGQRGLLLRLYACEHYLDCGRISDASDALAEAEAIYNESAQDLPTELHTPFVFGVAFLRRDAAGARLWWERMQSKKPTRFNVDYWLAYSALCWIENRLDEAQEAWQKCYALAQQLPKTGAYEFDRYRAHLLRQELDQPLVQTSAKSAPTPC